MKKFLLTVFITVLMSLSFYDVEAATVYGIKDGGTYDEDISVFVSDADTIILNGTEIEQGFIINEVGNHTIELYKDGILKDTINFTIEPRFSYDLEGEGLFTDNVVIKLENRGTLYVNSRQAENGQMYTDIGIYKIKVEGINDYVKEFTFILEDETLNYIDGKVYSFNVTVDVDDYHAVYYENVKMYSDLKLTKYGHYEVRVLGLNNYTRTYKFTIGINSNYLYDGKVFENVNQIRVDQKLAEILYIDNQQVKGTQFINTIGNHTIKYVGLNGYEKVYNITLREHPLVYDKKFLDGNTFESFNMKYSGYNLYLNGKKYTSGTEITAIGDYTLTLVGKNKYFSEYEFRIWRETHLPEDGEVTNQAINLFLDYETIYVNGVKRENYRITESGDYEILLWGVGDYTEHHNFTYVNEHEEQAKDFMVIAVTFAGLTVVAYGFLAWRRFR